MNISYFRKSDRSPEDAVEKLSKALSSRGATILGETKLPKSAGTVVHFINPEWTASVANADRMVAGLVPGTALIAKDGEKTILGILNPELLGGSEHLPEIAPVIDEMSAALRAAVNEASGAAEPKVAGLTLYSTTTCPYCRMEKDYLEKNGVAFDQIMVDTDRKVAEEMVKKTGQMGVPVTEVKFDDGDTEFIVGFDKARLGELLKIGK